MRRLIPLLLLAPLSCGTQGGPAPLEELPQWSATEDLRIGASHQPDQSGHFHGIIDDVRLFEAALSTANIRQIYAQATCG